MALFYRPPKGWAGDFIPFYWQGDYHLFYLQDFREGTGVDWYHLVTSDFVHFQELGEALPRGEGLAQDAWVFTGCVMEHAGTFHIFYTGHNPALREAGRPQEAILHATSPDLQTWTKDPDFFFPAPLDQGYEPDDWRDPFVFWNEEAGEWLMLLAARKMDGPARNRGLTACAASPDLKNWRVVEPFWEPHLYFTHECPDLFKLGDWWYFIWSEFSDRHITRYRLSRNFNGPWLKPADDAFDTRAYYAAKTGGDDRQRYLFGWLATREGENDSGKWQWGGELVVHELSQRPDGTLAVRPPTTIQTLLTQPVTVQPAPVLGNWQTDGPGYVADTPHGYAALLLADLPGEFVVEATAQYAPGTASFGLLLRISNDFEHYFQVRLEPANRRLVIDNWPRPGDQPFIFERPLALQPETPLKLSCFVSGTAVVIYANGEVALSCRMYDQPTGHAGLFVSEGKVNFSAVTIRR